MDSWFKDGPLGWANIRNNLGSSAKLGRHSKEGLRKVVVDASANMRADLAGPEPTGRAIRRALSPVIKTRQGQGDSMASALAVTCSYESANPQNDERPLQVRGVIEWGTDGHQCRAYFDWLNGTVVQVSAASVRVTAEVIPSLALGETVPSFDANALVQVGGILGYWASSRRAPTYTQQVLLSAGALSEVEIPPYARGLTITGALPTIARWALGPALPLAAVDVSGVSSRVLYQRPAPAMYLQLQNAAPELVTLIWELSL